jgi:hypothetical protein
LLYQHLFRPFPFLQGLYQWADTENVIFQNVRIWWVNVFESNV